MAGLNRQQLSELERNLREWEQSVLAQVREELGLSPDDPNAEVLESIPGDAADLSVGRLLADLNLSLIDRHGQEVQDIEAARARIAEGSYGICIDCGLEIDFERLRAWPTAVRCVSCQNLFETTHAGNTRPRL